MDGKYYRENAPKWSGQG